MNVGYSCLAQKFQGLVVIDPVVVDDAAVSVVGVLAHADIGYHHHVGMVFLDHPHGFLHDAFGVIPFGAQGVFLGGQSEQQNGRDAQLQGLANLLGQHVQRHLKLAGHGLDGFFDAVSVGHEQGINELFYREAGLPGHVAHGFATAQAAQP